MSLKPSEHQVAGHMKGGTAATLVDNEGKFYKPLQEGPRGAREYEFYETVKGNSMQEKSSKKECTGTLQTFMPTYYGSTTIDGVKHIIVQDINFGYDKPSCLDLKIGFRTWYEAPWNSDDWISNRKAKDEREGLTQLGFKLCGMNLWLQSEGRYWKQERDYWRSLATREPVVEELRRFACNGSGLAAREIYGPALSQLEAISRWFETQEEYCFYGCSVLMTYEGAAVAAEDLKVSCKLIDFAHSFGGQQQKDMNFLGGLRSVMSLIKEAADI